MKALIATAKGLVVYQLSENENPRILANHFIGFNTTTAYIDVSNNRWWVGISHKHWGQKLHFSDNEGATWSSAEVPSFEGASLPGGGAARIRQIWTITNAGIDRPGCLWMGTDPGGLFYSSDNGESFKLISNLWNHPSRKTEGQWFGAGSDYPFIHSIVVNPADNDNVFIAVSCAGVFETTDGGKSWHARNNGLIAGYLPNPSVEVGHDPHILRMNSNQPDVMWQQNHCGIYYTTDRGREWKHVSKEGRIPDYGFAMVIDDDPATAWVIPVQSDEQRVAPDLNLRVYQTSDFGQTWLDDSVGLPQNEVFDIVLRQAFEKSGDHMLFGTSNGNLYYRKSDEKWRLINSHLTKINLVIISN